MFATSVLDPLEAQGRGFSHGHKKVMSVPRTAEAKLRQMFEQDDGALRETSQCTRDELLRCAAAIMYDSATLPAEQLGEKALPDIFIGQTTVSKSSRWQGGDRRNPADAAGGNGSRAAGACGARANGGGSGSENMQDCLQRRAAHRMPAVGVA